MNRTEEPVVFLGAIPGVFTAALAVLLAFGVDITEEQVATLLGLVAALIAAVTAIQRNRVWPDAKVQEIMDADSIIADAELR